MPSNLMSLPPEIREQILKYCLITDHPLNPYPMFHEDPDPFTKAPQKPNVSLLQVCRLLHRESAPILYGQNTWSINRNNTSIDSRIAAFSHQAKHVRHVRISFTPQDITASEMRDISRRWTERYPNPNDNDYAARQQLIAQERFELLTFICSGKRTCVHKLSLRTLEVNVEDLYCPNGCCRALAIRRVCAILLPNYGGLISASCFYAGPPEHRDRELRIVGLSFEGEWALFRSLMGLPLAEKPAEKICEIVVDGSKGEEKYRVQGSETLHVFRGPSRLKNSCGGFNEKATYLSFNSLY